MKKVTATLYDQDAVDRTSSGNPTKLKVGFKPLTELEMWVDDNAKDIAYIVWRKMIFRPLLDDDSIWAATAAHCRFVDELYTIPDNLLRF